MRQFRRSVYRRLLALMALAGIGAWAAAPLAAAHPQTAAAQMSRALSGGGLDAATAEALASAASGEQADYTEALAEALFAALAARADGGGLAELLERHSPESLLELLLGHLLQANPAPHPLMGAFVAGQVSPAGVSTSGGFLQDPPSTVRSASSIPGLLAPGDGARVSIWEVSSAQPLGP